MKSKLIKYVIPILITIVGTYYITSTNIDSTYSAMLADIESFHASNYSSLLSIASALRTGQVDNDIQKILHDCSSQNRAEFDTLLDALRDADNEKLKRTSDLFEACAYFYSEQNAVTLMRMEKAVMIHTNLSKILNRKNSNDYQIDHWQTLLEIERDRNVLIQEQVVIQDKIIKALQVGESLDSDKIKKLIEDARSVVQKAEVLSKRSNIESKKTKNEI